MKTTTNMRRKWFKCKILDSQEGASAVEFAIVFPLLVLLLFAMIEFGLYLFNHQVITNACREGARFGIVARQPRRTNAEIASWVLDRSSQYLITFGGDTLTADDLTIKTEDYNLDDGFDPSTSRCMSFGCDLEVRADYTYHFLFLSTIGIDSISIQGVSQMRME